MNGIVLRTDFSFHRHSVGCLRSDSHDLGLYFIPGRASIVDKVLADLENCSDYINLLVDVSPVLGFPSPNVS